MPELARLLALLAFVALVIAFLLFLHRAGRVLGDARTRHQFRRAAHDLVERACQSLDSLAERVDAVRRGTLAAPLVSDDLEAAATTMDRYGEEAHALPAAGPETRAIRSSIVGELARAGRAVQLVEHGVGILAVSRRATGRELEAQTSIKRGYLGLLHAREALVAHAARAEELVTPAARPARPVGAASRIEHESDARATASSGMIRPHHKG